MPFTPYHMGPGILIKSILRGSFSLMVFGWAQIVMDLQPLVAILTGEGKWHGWTHTFLAALVLGAASAVTGKYLSEWGLALLAWGRKPRLVIGWTVAFISAWIGTFSHILIDGVLHREMEPLAPFVAGNPLFLALTQAQVQKFCLICGALGTVVYFAVQLVVILKKQTLRRVANRKDQ